MVGVVVAAVVSACTPPSTPPSTPVQAVEVVVGDLHGCARMSNGTVRCWGDNSYGQVGDGTLVNRDEAVPVVGLAGVVKLAAGSGSTCASTGTKLYCWGWNFFGQIGDGTAVDRSTPVQVPLVAGTITSFDVGSNHACALVEAGSTVTTQCWGDNQFGQLGTGDTTDRLVPTTLGSPPAAGHLGELSASNGSTCMTALSSSTTRALACTGLNATGVGVGRVWGAGLSDPTSSLTFNATAAIQLSDEARLIVAGGDTRCRLRLGDGVMGCAGSNVFGQLGDGTTTDSAVSAVDLPGPFDTASVGFGNVCAHLTSGGYRCSGSNLYGELGIGTVGGQSSVPVDVVGIAAPASKGSIAAGLAFVCALGVDNGVRHPYCWGADEIVSGYGGRLGNGPGDTDSAVPTRVLGFT